MQATDEPIPIGPEWNSFARVDFRGQQSLSRGDDYEVTFVWSRNGVAVDMTGWSGVVRLYQPGQDAPFYEGPLTLGADGSIAFMIPHATTATLWRGDVLYRCVLTDRTGFVRTRVLGLIRAL